MIPKTEDLAGIGNANLDETRDRLVKGASWKPQRVAVVMPCGDMIPTRAAISWWGLVFPPNQQWIRIPVEGMEVGDAYSHAIDEVILKHPELSKWEYVLTLEHDQTTPHDALIGLLKSMEEHPEYAAISGLYFTKGAGGCAQIWGDITDPNINFRPVPPVPDQVIECYGIGMGFALWRMSMFKDERLKRPLFRTIAGKEGAGTQDLSFCQEARRYGYRFAVDCSVKIGHLDFEGKFGPKGVIY